MIAQGISVSQDGNKRNLKQVLAFPNITFDCITAFDNRLLKIESEVQQQVHRDALYSNYIDRQKKDIEAIKRDEELKELLGTSDYEHFIISSSNFKPFYKDKSLDKYVVYFEGEYLKQK